MSWNLRKAQRRDRKAKALIRGGWRASLASSRETMDSKHVAPDRRLLAVPPEKGKLVTDL